MDVRTELAQLIAEQQKIAQNYKEAQTVLNNCEKRLLQLQGAIAFAEKQLNEGSEKTATDKKTTDKKTTES